MDPLSIYSRAPAWLQNVALTGYGIRQLWMRHGASYWREVSRFEERERLPLSDLLEFRDARLRDLISFCYERVPYYRRVFDERGLRPRDVESATDLVKLPILEKRQIQENPDEFRPHPELARGYPQSTGGTTGRPLRYYATRQAVQYNYAAYEARFRRWAGVRFGQRLASIGGRVVVPIEATTPPFWRRNLAFNQLYLSAYHLREENLGHYVRALEEFDPVVVVGYASTLHTLARYLIANGGSRRIRPRAVLTSSETLFSWIREDLEQGFGCKVFDGYGLGELVALLTECEHGSLHDSVDYGIVETVDTERGSELICSGLFNTAMPLVRYRTGDLAESGDGAVCDCGRSLPLVRNLVGRVDDRLVTPEGNVVGPAAMSLAFQSVPLLKDAQVHQDAPSKIDVIYTAENGFGAHELAFLEQELRLRLGQEIEILTQRVDEIPRTMSGKQRLIVSSLKLTGVVTTLGGPAARASSMP